MRSQLMMIRGDSIAAGVAVSVRVTQASRLSDRRAPHRRRLSAKVPRHGSLTPAPELSMIFLLDFVLSPATE